MNENVMRRNKNRPENAGPPRDRNAHFPEKSVRNDETEQGSAAADVPPQRKGEAPERTDSYRNPDYPHQWENTSSKPRTKESQAPYRGSYNEQGKENHEYNNTGKEKQESGAHDGKDEDEK